MLFPLDSFATSNYGRGTIWNNTMSYQYQINPRDLNHSSVIYDVLKGLGYTFWNSSSKADWLEDDPNYIIDTVHKGVSANYRNGSGFELGIADQVVTLGEFLDAISQPQPPTFQIAGYTVQVLPKGIQFGCTLISWDDYGKIATAVKEVRGDK